MIRNKVLILISFSFILACSSDEHPSLTGTWQHTASLLDPGDGSGSFKDVESDLSIEIFLDSSFVSNAAFCFDVFPNELSIEVSGLFNSEGQIIQNGCSEVNLVATYDFKGDELIISNPRCIEPCFNKFERN